HVSTMGSGTRPSSRSTVCTSLPVELGAVLGGLPALAVRRRLVGLEPRLDQLVLGKESGQVGNEILHDRQVWQRRNPARSRLQAVDRSEAGEVVLAIDVHRARSAHAFTTGF